MKRRLWHCLRTPFHLGVIPLLPPDRLRDPPSLLYNGYPVFPGRKGGRGVMLTTHPLLVARLRKSWSITPRTLWVLLGLLLGSSYLIPLTSRWKIQDLLPEKSSPCNSLRRWDKARKNLIQNWRRMEVRYNPHRKPPPFKVGDLFWFRSHHVSCAGEGISAKILHRWEKVCLKLTPFLRPLRLGWFILSPDFMYRELIFHR
jgi:hypothetical protein